jgi:hypothetical protein
MYQAIWALLPIILFILAFRFFPSYLRKRPEARFFIPLLKQALYAAIFLAIAIAADYWGDEYILQTKKEIQFLRWLIYPAIMLVAAKFQQQFIDRDNAAKDKARKDRQKKYGTS